MPEGMVERTASTQYGDMTGTAAMDTADFRGLQEALDLPQDVLIVGVSVFLHHVPLHAGDEPFSHGSSTYLSVYTLDRGALQDGEGLPGLARDGVVEVAEHRYETAKLEYAELPEDAWTLVALASKRLSLKLWDRAFDGADVEVVSETYYVRRGGDRWTVYEGE